jgi:hypothetical protein
MLMISRVTQGRWFSECRRISQRASGSSIQDPLRVSEAFGLGWDLCFSIPNMILTDDPDISGVRTTLGVAITKEKSKSKRNKINKSVAHGKQ